MQRVVPEQLGLFIVLSTIGRKTVKQFADFRLIESGDPDHCSGSINTVCHWYFRYDVEFPIESPGIFSTSFPCGPIVIFEIMRTPIFFIVIWQGSQVTDPMIERFVTTFKIVDDNGLAIVAPLGYDD